MRPGAPLGKVDRIIVHHSATEDSGTLSWTALKRFHMEHHGWSDIGYHAGVEFVRDGYVVIVGRPEDRTGAHTVGQNNRSLGFVFVGNYDKSVPSEEMLQTAVRSWFVPVLLRYGIGVENVLPHSQFASKTCPGKFFDMKRLRGMIRSTIQG